MTDTSSPDAILVPVDGSATAHAAMLFAVRLLHARGAGRLVLLNVQPPVESGLVRAQLSAATIEAGLRGWGEDVLRPCREHLDRLGVAHSAHVEIGHFGVTIAEAPERFACGEIVMGSRGSGPMAKLVVGSVATQVVHAAKAPVTLVKRTADGPAPFDPVLVAIDGSDNANRAVRYLIERWRGCPAINVKLLHVRELFAVSPGEDDALPAGARRVAMTPEEATHEARRLLQEAGIPYLVDIRFGDPGVAIARAASADGCSHIVMGTRGLGALDALLLGSVAYTTLHAADVPVTLVK